MYCSYPIFFFGGGGQKPLQPQCMTTYKIHLSYYMTKNTHTCRPITILLIQYIKDTPGLSLLCTEWQTIFFNRVHIGGYPYLAYYSTKVQYKRIQPQSVGSSYTPRTLCACCSQSELTIFKK